MWKKLLLMAMLLVGGSIGLSAQTTEASSEPYKKLSAEMVLEAKDMDMMEKAIVLDHKMRVCPAPTECRQAGIALSKLLVQSVGKRRDVLIFLARAQDARRKEKLAKQ